MVGEKFHSQVQLHVTNSFKIAISYVTSKERNSCGINTHTVSDCYCLFSYLSHFKIYSPLLQLRKKNIY